MIIKKRDALFICIIFLITNYCGCIQDNSKSLTVDINGSGDFISIREAINNSLDGYTIYVKNGIYNETISIMKSVAIYGDDIDNTIITCNDDKYGINLVNIIGNNCTFSGFTIINSCNSSDLTGIKISSHDSTIENNIIRETQVGIYISRNAVSNIISGNFISNNTNGISLFSAYNNLLIDNIISNNFDSGIRLKDSKVNTITRNYIKTNEKGIYLCCEAINNVCYNNIFEQNIQMHVKGSAGNQWDNGSIGNYWAEYINSDQNNNGIGDEPYLIEGDVMVDIYPLINKPKIYNNIY